MYVYKSQRHKHVNIHNKAMTDSINMLFCALLAENILFEVKKKKLLM